MRHADSVFRPFFPRRIQAKLHETASPVLLISSQNRAGRDTGNLTSLAESSGIEYGADTVLLLTKDDKAVPAPGCTHVLANIEKNRHGPTSTSVPMQFWKATSLFYETETRR